MKIFLALKQIEFALKMFSAAGFTNFAAAFDSKNENALKDFLAQGKTVERLVEKVIEPTDEQLTALVTAELREHITAAGFTLAADADPIAALKQGLAAHPSLTAQLTEATSQISNLKSQIELATSQLTAIRAAKIEFPADANAEAVAAAVNSRISRAAGEALAKRGLAEFPEQEISADPTKVETKTAAKTASLTGRDRMRADFARQLARMNARN